MTNKYIQLRVLASMMEMSTDSLRYSMKILKVPTVMVPAKEGVDECIFPMDAATLITSKLVELQNDITRIERKQGRLKDFQASIA